MKYSFGAVFSMISLTLSAQVIDFFPYTESFESSTTLWSGVVESPQACISGDNPMVRNMGGTLELGTGPSAAQDGQYYVYLDIFNMTCQNQNFIIKSPTLNLSIQSSATISFDYHMNGANIGTLQVQASLDNGNNWSADLLTTALNGDQGNSWLSTTVDLSSYTGSSNVLLRFVATSTSGPAGNIAIDNISITTTPILRDAVYTYDEAGNRLSRTYEVTTMAIDDPLMAELRSVAESTELSAELFNIYPNPAIDHVILETSMDLNHDIQMSLFDYSGQLVRDQSLKTPVTRIDLSQQNAGIYILIVQSAEGVRNWKIVKN